MTALLEPSLGFWMLLVTLFSVAAILAAMWTATGRREPLMAAGVAVALIPIWWMVERLVVTDREAIEATLHQIAADVKSNNRAAVLRYIHSQESGLRAKAEREMVNYEFTECKINKLHGIDLSPRSEPRSAAAHFNVYVSGTFRVSGETFTGDFVRRIDLFLRQEADGQWRVVNYDHSSPLPGRRGEDAREFAREEAIP